MTLIATKKYQNDFEKKLKIIQKHSPARVNNVVKNACEIAVIRICKQGKMVSKSMIPYLFIYHINLLDAFTCSVCNGASVFF